MLSRRLPSMPQLPNPVEPSPMRHMAVLVCTKGQVSLAIILFDNQNPAALMSVRDMSLKKACTVVYFRKSWPLNIFWLGEFYHSSDHLRDPDL